MWRSGCRSFTQFVPQNAAAPRRPTGKVCAPWQKNRKPDTDTAGSAQKNMAFLCRAFPRVKVRRGKSPVRQTRGFQYKPVQMMVWYGNAGFPVPTRSPRWIGSARPGFPYRPSLRDGLVLVRPNDVLPEKVRLRVICPAEGRFSGENSLSAQIRPEPGFGGQIHANREFVRQTRPSPYRLVSAMDWFDKAGFPVPNEADTRDGHAAKRRLPTAPPHPDTPRATPRPQLSQHHRMSSNPSKMAFT